MRYRHRNRQIKAAIKSFKEGIDIPLDLEISLLSQGVDVAGLRSIYLR